MTMAQIPTAMLFSAVFSRLPLRKIWTTLTITNTITTKTISAPTHFDLAVAVRSAKAMPKAVKVTIETNPTT